MSDLIGTVHKPQQPEVPEPEGWIPIALEEWAGKKVWLVPEGVCILFESQKTASLFVDSRETPYRLVYIGPAPNVPVEAIQSDSVLERALARLQEVPPLVPAQAIRLGISALEALAANLPSGAEQEHYRLRAEELRSWLSAQEEGDK